MGTIFQFQKNQMTWREKFELYHSGLRNNMWMGYFALFTRLLLAAGFIPSGMVKILGERFTALSNNHPMGHYLEALHQTGYYYTFIGIAQISAAILLLIPRTVTLGALLYLPIITNICLLTFATRFDGSLITAPLMLTANIFLLFWHYDQIKHLVPIGKIHKDISRKSKSKTFPFRFMLASFSFVVLLVLGLSTVYSIKPRNTKSECLTQFTQEHLQKAGCEFCECIHEKGHSLEKCLSDFKKKTQLK